MRRSVRIRNQSESSDNEVAGTMVVPAQTKDPIKEPKTSLKKKSIENNSKHISLRKTKNRLGNILEEATVDSESKDQKVLSKKTEDTALIGTSKRSQCEKKSKKVNDLNKNVSKVSHSEDVEEECDSSCIKKNKSCKSMKTPVFLEDNLDKNRELKAPKFFEKNNNSEKKKIVESEVSVVADDEIDLDVIEKVKMKKNRRKKEEVVICQSKPKRSERKVNLLKSVISKKKGNFIEIKPAAPSSPILCKEFISLDSVDVQSHTKLIGIDQKNYSEKSKSDKSEEFLSLDISDDADNISLVPNPRAEDVSDNCNPNNLCLTPESMSDIESNVKLLDASGDLNIDACTIPKCFEFTGSLSGLKKNRFHLNESKYTDMIKGIKKSVLIQDMKDFKNNFSFKKFLVQDGDNGVENEKNVESKADICGLDSVAIPNSQNATIFSSIQSNMDFSGLHLTDDACEKKKKLETQVNEIMKKSVLKNDLEKRESAPKLFVSKQSLMKERKKKALETAGKGWYNLPKTELTDEIKNDLQIIKMRNVLDSKKHFKRNDTDKLPKYFQIGTIVEGNHEFYTSRVPKKMRKRTMVDELLADAEFRSKNKKKFIALQKKQMNSSKKFYNPRNIKSRKTK